MDNNIKSPNAPKDGTILDSNRQPNAVPPVPPTDSTKVTPTKATKKDEKSSATSTGIATGVGAGIGAAIGAMGGAVITGMQTDEPLKFEEVEDDEVIVEEEEVVVVETPEYSGNVPLASGVNDSMSFAQAFSAARAEVGSGGVFHWHGQTYNTFTAEEWNSMSAEDQSAFGRAAVGAGPAPTYHHTTTTTTTTEVGPEPPAPPTPPTTPDDEIQVLSVEHLDGGANRATLSVDDQMAVLIDLDGDMKFDYMIVDRDNDGIISEAEVDQAISLEDGNITVASLGGFTDGHGETNYAAYDSPDQPDYVNDANVDVFEA